MSACAAALLAWLAAAPATAAAARTVPVGDFLREAAREDVRFHLVLADRLTLEHEKALALPADDWVVRVLGGYELPLAGGEGEDSGSVRLDRLFPRTGGALSAEAAQGPGDASRWELGFGQELARNAFGRGVRLEEDIEDLRVALAEHQIVEAYEDYLARLAESYLDWFVAHENLKTARAALEENLALLENLEERLRRSVALPVDVEKGRLQVLDKEEQVERRTADYVARSHEIRRAMGLDPGTVIEPADPTAHWTLPGAGEDGALARFSADSRTARLLRRAEERGAKTVLLRADELLPSLRLGVAYSGSDSEAAGTEERVAGRVELGFPFGRRRERARHEIAKVELERAKLTTEDVLRRTRTGLRALFVRIRSETRRVGMAEERIRVAADILEQEREEYSFGRTTLNDLIRFVDAEEAARFSLIARRVERARLLVEWLRLADRLVADRDLADAGRTPAP